MLGGRAGKRSRRALRYLTGGGGGSFWTNPTTLLTAAGVAWGIFETLQQTGRLPGSGGSPRRAAGASRGRPPACRAAVAERRLAMSDREALRHGAAGDFGGERRRRDERAGARRDPAAGARRPASARSSSASCSSRVRWPRSSPASSDPAQRATLYVLAFTMLRADEQVTGAERIYLAQLANLLGLDAATVQQLETTPASRIDALGDQGSWAVWRLPQSAS